VIAVIIQARMGSRRLPGKTMADVAGAPMLSHVVRRAAAIPGIERVVIATTPQPADRVIVDFASRNGIPVFVGSEDDVLDRFHQAARHVGATVVVRVTPDCPLLDPAVSGLVLARYLQDGTLDYVSNTQPPSFPDGLDTEVFSFQALEVAWQNSVLRSEREHVTPYLWKRPELFRTACVHHDRDLSAMRWTVDEPRDLEFVRKVYDHLGTDRCFAMEDVLDLLRRHPGLAATNAGVGRNEGLLRSLDTDGIAGARGPVKSRRATAEGRG
jgi:spore coat polysaccharide biosynthesis protein SpsF (cytidylyltransferase family)